MIQEGMATSHMCAFIRVWQFLSYRSQERAGTDKKYEIITLQVAMSLYIQKHCLLKKKIIIFNGLQMCQSFCCILLRGKKERCGWGWSWPSRYLCCWWPRWNRCGLWVSQREEGRDGKKEGWEGTEGVMETHWQLLQSSVTPSAPISLAGFQAPNASVYATWYLYWQGTARGL